jgi:hypothetical protein
MTDDKKTDKAPEAKPAPPIEPLFEMDPMGPTPEKE